MPTSKARHLFVNLRNSVQADLTGVRFAVNVFIAAAILWFTLRDVADTNPIWAIASMVAAADPVIKEAKRLFRARIINVLVGCGVGLVFLVLGGSREWKLPLALAVTVLISSYLVRITAMWRQAPVTAAIVIASGITTHSKLIGIEHGLHKVGEVLLGCFTGLLVSYMMTRVWPIPEPTKKAGT